MGNKKDISYNYRWHRTLFMRAYKRIHSILMNLIDARQDRRICGQSLTRSIVSTMRETKGATNSSPTRYWILDSIFNKIKVRPDDHVLDVGCGKGRVLAYLADRDLATSVTGVELDPRPAANCRKWIGRYPKLRLIEGNVMDIYLNDYTMLYMFHPITKDFLPAFFDKIEQELTHPLRLVYLNDLAGFPLLNDRPGWTLIKRGLIWKKHGLYLYAWPQMISAWSYERSDALNMNETPKP